MGKKRIEPFQLKLPFSLFLGIFSDGGVANWISALSIILEYSNEMQHKSNKMYKKPHKCKKLQSGTNTRSPLLLLSLRYNGIKFPYSFK